jgi:hypothetical protein
MGRIKPNQRHIVSLSQISSGPDLIMDLLSWHKRSGITHGGDEAHV